MTDLPNEIWVGADLEGNYWYPDQDSANHMTRYVRADRAPDGFVLIPKGGNAELFQAMAHAYVNMTFIPGDPWPVVYEALIAASRKDGE